MLKKVTYKEDLNDPTSIELQISDKIEKTNSFKTDASLSYLQQNQEIE